MTKLTNPILHMINVYPEVDLKVMIDSTEGEILKIEVEAEKNIIETKVVINRNIRVVIDRGIEVVIDKGIGVVTDRGIEVVTDREIGVVID